MRREVNRADEMAVFVKVVDLGGFAAAARVRGLAPSAVSRIVSRLERRLGVALLRRSTRRIALTPEGERFYRRSQAVLADLDAAEREASGGALPIGRVRAGPPPA
jgi:DNA-binding transcriptional LysR family regulator